MQKYPEIIAMMPEYFNTHEFILKLAWYNQSLYVQALASYGEKTSPFQIVHGQLAQRLYKFPELVQKVGEVASANIFGESSKAVVWHRRR